MAGNEEGGGFGARELTTKPVVGVIKASTVESLRSSDPAFYRYAKSGSCGTVGLCLRPEAKVVYDLFLALRP